MLPVSTEQGQVGRAVCPEWVVWGKRLWESEINWGPGVWRPGFFPTLSSTGM